MKEDTLISFSVIGGYILFEYIWKLGQILSQFRYMPEEYVPTHIPKIIVYAATSFRSSL